MKRSFGFTLIELLVTIGILGVLAIAGFIVIDPIDKINSANDSKVQTDISQLARAMETYSVVHTGVYATDFSFLLTSGEMKSISTAPNNYLSYSLGQTTGSPTSQSICGQLKAKKYSSSPNWVWCSQTGKMGSVTSCSACP